MTTYARRFTAEETMLIYAQRFVSEAAKKKPKPDDVREMHAAYADLVASCADSVDPVGMQSSLIAKAIRQLLEIEERKANAKAATETQIDLFEVLLCRRG